MTSEKVKSLVETADEVQLHDNQNGFNPSHKLRHLAVGSDVEIARRVCSDLEQTYGQIVYVDGRFWHYQQTHWRDFTDRELRLAVHNYDGAFYGEGRQSSQVKLGKGRVDSVLNEISVLLTQPEFFSDGACGINCASGFIRFDTNGAVSLTSHNPDHRCRHVLPAKWSKTTSPIPSSDSLLHRLLGGVFYGDPDANDKVSLVAEVIGAAALGHATKVRQPRAIILKGETAENGKSQILDLARALLPKSAICSISATRMADDRHVVDLAGKLLNASDELSAEAISSDIFKSIITGEPVSGREVYKIRVEFRPIAQHVFATNVLPSFAGGMDRGIQRRVLVIPFNRVIPEKDRVEFIGQRIGKEESDLLLAFAVDGASRLIRQQRFTMPASSKEALYDWLYSSDPVLAWVEGLNVHPISSGLPRVRTRDAYRAFRIWAVNEGFDERKLPSINTFTQRMKANTKGIEYRRTQEGRFLLGIDQSDLQSKA